MESWEVFLSYPRKAIDECQRIAEAIKSWGFEVFFDSWSVAPGDPWPLLVDKAIKTVDIAVICVGSEGFGTRQSKEVLGLFDEQCSRSELRLIPFLLRGARWADVELPFYLRPLTAATTLEELRKAVAGIRTPIGPGLIDERPLEGATEVEALYVPRPPRPARGVLASAESDRGENLLPFGTLEELRSWLSGQEAGQDLLSTQSRQQFLSSLETNPSIYTALAEEIACEDPPNPWVEHLLLRGFIDHYGAPTVKAELDRAFDRWFGFVHPAAFPARAGQGEEEAERQLKMFEQRIGQPIEPGEIEVAGYRLTVVSEACLLRLTRLALAVLSSCPGDAGIRSVVRGCLAEAVMGYPEKYHLFAWYLRWSTEVTRGEVEAEARHLIATDDVAAKQAAFRLLSLQGSAQAAQLQRATLEADELFPPDPEWAKYSDTCMYGKWSLEDCKPCLERDDVPFHILAYNVSRWCPEPGLEFPATFIGRLAEEADKLPTEKVWQGMYKEHRLDTLEGPLCAGAPEIYGNLIRRLVTEKSDADGQKIWRWTLELKEYLLFLTEKERELAYRTWKRLARKKDPDSDEQSAERFLFELILPDLAASRQLSDLLNRSADARNLERHEAAFRPLSGSAAIKTLLADEDTTPRSRVRILWFLSVNATAVPPELLAQIPLFLSDEEAVVRFSALRLLYEAKQPGACRHLVDNGWCAALKNLPYENYWGSLILATWGQHLSFEELKARMDLAYLGYAIEKRGFVPEEVAQYGEELHQAWTQAVGQDSRLLDELPEVEIESPIDSAEPSCCRWAVLWDRLQPNEISFINPLFYWGCVPDEASSYDFKPWDWPNDEERRTLEKLQRKETKRQHQLGIFWFGRELNTSALPEVVESRPDLVAQWLAVGRSQLRLGSTFYEGLCGVLLRKARDEGLSLYWKLKGEWLPVRITVNGIERLDYFLFQAPAQPQVCREWEKRLVQCRTDKELLELAIVAEYGNGANWLWTACQQGLSSPIVRDQARALMLLGLSISSAEPARASLEKYSRSEPDCWLSEVARSALDSWRSFKSAQHWLRRFWTVEINDQAQAAFRLLLRCADRRLWGWQEGFETSPGLPDFTRRKAFFESNRDTLKNRIRANETALAKTLFGTQVVEGQIEPWLF